MTNSKQCDWSLFTFEDAVEYAKSLGKWAEFRYKSPRTFQHIVDQGWVLHVIPYIVHNSNSYATAKRLHEDAMKRAAKRAKATT